MNFEATDISDDLEPREVMPRLAQRFECLPVPSVPEVSLVFDKPSGNRGHGDWDNTVPHSPTTIDKYEFYATWKQKKLSAKIGYESSGRIDSVNNDPTLKNPAAEQLLKRVGSSPGSAEKINERRTKRGEPVASIDHRRVDDFSRSQERDRRYLTRGTNQNIRENGQGKQNSQSIGFNNDVGSCIRHQSPNLRAQRTQQPNFGLGSSAVDQRCTNRQEPLLHSSGFVHPSPDSENFQNFPLNVYQRYPYPTYFESYPYQCPPNFPSRTSENEETVKNLLQLVNSQNEQIKSLQGQVDRLLKIQEESLKDRAKCGCMRNEQAMPMQNLMCLPTSSSGRSGNSNGGVHSSIPMDETGLSQRQLGTVERNFVQYDAAARNVTTTTTPGSRNDYNGKVCTEDQTNNKILEQKVSIGVMTSFEFTVQNNPFAQDTEEQRHRKCFESKLTGNEIEYEYRGNDNKVPTANEVPRGGRNENVFSRISNAPLENIIEDSESHISSSRQPSSNYHQSHSMEESPTESAARRTDKNSPQCFVHGNDQEIEFENSLEHEKRQRAMDSQRRFENVQRSRGSRVAENTPKTRNSEENDFQRRQRAESLSRKCLADHRQESGTQNFDAGIFNVVRLDSPKQSRLAPDDYRSPCAQRNKQCQQSDLPNGKIANGLAAGDVRNDYRIQGRQETTNTKEGNYVEETARPKSTESMDYVEERSEKVPRSEKNSQDNYVDESIVLNLKERPPPSPEPSIHVDMQEYSSDEDSEKDKRNRNHKQSAKVGWTFYNNVLGQVNQILQSSPISTGTREQERQQQQQQQQQENVMQPRRNNKEEDCGNKANSELVKMATMEQLRRLGISFVENADSREPNETSNKRVTFDSSYYPRVEYMTQTGSAISETDTSMRMNALALKYLSDEQLGDLAMRKHRNGHGAEGMKHLMVSNVQGTNMSFATMRYLERYHLLPGKTQPQPDTIVSDEGKENFDLKHGTPTRNTAARRPPPTVQTTRTSYPSKILDISTLKQQPKLL